MRILFRPAVVATSLVVVSAGVAHADPVPIADVSQSADTDDGWHVTASLSKMMVNSVPNMAATALTRDAFVTGEASAKIDGSGKSAVNSGELILGVQLGCQVDLSQGGNFSPGGDIGAGVNIGNGIGIGLGGLADIDPSISVNILPAAWQHHNNGARQKCAPSDISTAGLSESGKGGDSGSDKVTPIVMPYGQSPPPKEDSDSTSTSTTPTPILPAGG